jgi:hypothetical protein
MFVEITESAEPQLPGLHIARWNADRYALQALAVQALLAEGSLDVLVSPLETDGIGIHRHQQADCFSRAPPEEGDRDSKTGEDERKAAFLAFPARFEVDAAPSKPLIRKD